jgi:uncharacterized protein YbjT (DUF2867 family)
MARALLVGCGCRGRDLGRRLLEAGWQVRGTSRRGEGLAAIEVAGIEPIEADPDRPGTLLDAVGDVTVVAWLLARAAGEAASLDAIHGPRLERLLEKLVDTPVRGFVYESAASSAGRLGGGALAVREAGRRWRIPVRVLEVDPDDHERWAAAALDAVLALTAPP